MCQLEAPYNCILFGAIVFLSVFDATSTKLPDRLDEDTCTEYFINTVPDDPLLEKEHCNICQMIVDNAEKWDYNTDLASLCNNVPPHAIDWVCIYLRLLCTLRLFSNVIDFFFFISTVCTLRLSLAFSMPILLFTFLQSHAVKPSVKQQREPGNTRSARLF